MKIDYDVLDLLSGERGQGRLNGASPVLAVGNASQLVLHVSVGDVFAYRREGDDLILILQNGERIRLDDFFGTEQPALVLVRQADPDGVIGLERGASEDFVQVRFVDTVPGFLTPRYSGVSISLAELGDGSMASLGLSSAGAGAAVAAAALLAFGVAGGGASDTAAPEAAGGLSIRTNSDGTMAISGTAEPGAKVTIAWPDGTTSTVTADETGKFTAGSATPQPQGTVSVTVTDGAGNTSDPATAPYRADTTDDTTAPAKPGNLSDTTNEDGTVTVTGAAEPGSTVSVMWPDGTITTATAGPDGRFTATSKNPQPQGATTVTATDASGNVSAPAVLTYDGDPTSDVTPPAFPMILRIESDSENVRITGSASDAITNDDTPTYFGTAEAGAVVSLYDGTSLVGTATADATGKWSIASGALTDGTRTLTATAADTSGNVSVPSESFSMTVDTSAAPPVVTGVSGDSGVSASDRVTNDNTLIISGMAEPDAVVDVYIGTAAIGSAVADAAGNWSYDHSGTALADGSYAIEARQWDVAGNMSEMSEKLALTIDTAAPTIEAMSNDYGTLGDFKTYEDMVRIWGYARPGETIEVLVDGVSTGTSAANAKGIWISTDIDLSGLTPGETVVVAAKDEAGNVSADQAVAKETAGGIDQTGDGGPNPLTGSDGDDVLIGGGGADTLLGLKGNDVLHVSDATFVLVDGGEGTDVLVLDGADIDLDFTGGLDAGNDVTGIEAIDITGSGANTLALSLQDVLDLSDTTDTLKVFGDADDAVNAAGFVLDAEPSEPIDGFSLYTNGGTQLWIEDTVGTVILV
ncbi:Ig-like domain-containing protein [Pelagibacterium halotolerans]|uniref:Ig-like domain-containing protein n=1 Tax=Pelagibacterium halotolerans TaxID=531813 RepID=UPI00384AD429